MSKQGEANLGFVLVEEYSDKEQPAIPVAVYLQPDATKLMVSSVYIDEGVLCIDVEDAEIAE
jgi:hypothetical protein